jgi:glycerol-1-phosphate dehydrogenase [NAD(P)+]
VDSVTDRRPVDPVVRIDDALALVRDTRTLRIGPGALDTVVEVVREDFPGERALIIADQRTYAAAGARVAAQLRTANLLASEPLVFAGDPPPYADRAHLARVEAALAPANAVPIAVGSGTINDLTKLAAHHAGRSYLCVATAASMDGYTSFGAIVTERGFKHTLGCPAPRAVIADLDVLATAPRELAAAGYGDLLGKVTAGADWLLADALGIEPIHGDAWRLVQGPLRGWLADPAAVRAGDRDALARLFEGLTVVGIAMQCASSSRPASGAEHRFSHLWEMEALGEGRPAHLHGAKVGVGSIATAALYERLLSRDLRHLDVDAAVRAYPSRAQAEAHARRSHRDPVVAEHAVLETRAKHVDRATLRARLERLRTVWDDLRHALSAQLLPPASLRDMLAAAGAPTRPEQIGVEPRRFRAAHGAARTIRARYTVLDLLFETRLLRPVVADVLGPGGYWRGARGG